jgi:hypothetical protein
VNTLDPPSPLSTRYGALLARATLFGAGVGTAVGGLWATFTFPFAGTFFGAIEGAIAGAVVGFLNGLALLRPASRTVALWRLRAIGFAMTSAGTATSLFVARMPWTILWDGPAVLIACATLAALSAPVVAYGTASVRLSVRGRRWALNDVLRKVVITGAIAGAVLGAIAGIVIGALSYLPTTPFAAVEGAILGGVSGVVAGLLVALVLVCFAAGRA